MRVFALALIAVFAAACSPLASVRAPAAGETSVVAAVSAAGGEQPNFRVVATAEGGEELDFTLNPDTADLGGAAPGSFADQTALIYYTSTETPFLLDIRTAEGRSLLYDDGRGVPVEGASITGVLRYSGDRSDDAPEQITITSADGATQTFTFFVDRRIGGANGRQVTAYYDMEMRRDITLMRVR